MTRFCFPLADVGSALTGHCKNVRELSCPCSRARSGHCRLYIYVCPRRPQKASQAKRAIGVAIVGAIVVAVALNGSHSVTSIGH